MAVFFLNVGTLFPLHHATCFLDQLHQHCSIFSINVSNQSKHILTGGVGCLGTYSRSHVTAQSVATLHVHSQHYYYQVVSGIAKAQETWHVSILVMRTRFDARTTAQLYFWSLLLSFLRATPQRTKLTTSYISQSTALESTALASSYSHRTTVHQPPSL